MKNRISQYFHRCSLTVGLIGILILTGCPGGVQDTPSTTAAVPAQTLTPGDVTVSTSGSNLSLNPIGTQSITKGSSQSFTVTTNPGYSVSTSVGGNCPVGSWNGAVYTTGAITSNCTVAFTSAATAISAVTIDIPISGSQFSDGTTIAGKCNTGSLINISSSANDFGSMTSTMPMTCAYSYYSTGVNYKVLGNRTITVSETQAGTIVSTSSNISNTSLNSPIPVPTNRIPTNQMFGVLMLTPCRAMASWAGFYSTGANSMQSFMQSDFNYFHSRGQNLIRMMLTWEAIQPTLYGPLSAPTITCINDALSMAANLGMKVILDIHNEGFYVINNAGGLYAGYGVSLSPNALNDNNYHFTQYTGAGGTGSVVNVGGAPVIAYSIGAPPAGGNPQSVPVSAFYDLWGRIAKTFASNTTNTFNTGNPMNAAIYGYDLMNEPEGMGGPGGDANGSAIYFQDVQAAIYAIRNYDMNNPVIIEGYPWASSGSWNQYNSNLAPQDPANNFIFEAHNYFDPNGSGIYPSNYTTEMSAWFPTNPNPFGINLATCASFTCTFLAAVLNPLEAVAHWGFTTNSYSVYKSNSGFYPFTAWLKAKGYRGYIGEYGVPADPVFASYGNGEYTPVMNQAMLYAQNNLLSATVASGGFLYNANAAGVVADGRGPVLSIEPFGTGTNGGSVTNMAQIKIGTPYCVLNTSTGLYTNSSSGTACSCAFDASAINIDRNSGLNCVPFTAQGFQAPNYTYSASCAGSASGSCEKFLMTNVVQNYPSPTNVILAPPPNP